MAEALTWHYDNSALCLLSRNDVKIKGFMKDQEQ